MLNTTLGLQVKTIAAGDANRHFSSLLRDAAIRQRLLDQGGVILGEGPDVFSARIARELAENIVIAREASIRVE